MICIADDTYMDNILKDLNSTVEDFIQLNLVNKSMDIHTNIPLLNHSADIKSCWELKKCGKKECPSYENEDYRCWLKVGTLCGGRAQGKFAQKYENCYRCNVLQQYNQTSIEALQENIAILIQHLGDRTADLREMAIKDTLTKCYNRNYLEQVSHHEEERVKRSGEPLSLILFDLNKFKEINDNKGHHVGDVVLLTFADFLRSKTRKAEMIFRLGGDEFLILMPNCTEGERLLAEKRLQHLEISVNLPDTNETITCSYALGGATAGANPSIEKLLLSADCSMYADKKGAC